MSERADQIEGLKRLLKAAVFLADGIFGKTHGSAVGLHCVDAINEIERLELDRVADGPLSHGRG